MRRAFDPDTFRRHLHPLFERLLGPGWAEFLGWDATCARRLTLDGIHPADAELLQALQETAQKHGLVWKYKPGAHRGEFTIR